MDDALLNYDESLEALEKQKENLERVMERMGAEWEESGAGIGWLGDSLFKDSNETSSYKDTTKSSSPPLMSLMHCVTSSSEPSHNYIQSLLNVNDELLAQSLASRKESNNYNHISSSSSSDNSSTNNSNVQMCYHSPMVKKTPFVPLQQVLPISPTSPEGNTTIQQPPQVMNFTPPITPE